MVGRRKFDISLDSKGSKKYFEWLWAAQRVQLRFSFFYSTVPVFSETVEFSIEKTAVKNQIKTVFRVGGACYDPQTTHPQLVS